MSKMTKPAVEVVRFSESDVIVASGIMRVTGLGNGKLGDAEFNFGPYVGQYSNDIEPKPTWFLERMSDYFGEDFDDLQKISIGGDTLGNLVSSDLGEQTEGHYGDRNGTYRWNGTYFDRISQ